MMYMYIYICTGPDLACSVGVLSRVHGRSKRRALLEAEDDSERPEGHTAKGLIFQSQPPCGGTGARTFSVTGVKELGLERNEIL